MSGKTALVIDDQTQNLKVLSQLLGRQGITCTEVSDPALLPSLLPTLEHVDIVFLDLEMPGIDGYTVKDMLRAHFGNTPIIAYTVHISEMNVVQEMGFDGFIAKPVSSLRFPDQLARILKGEAVWDRV
jgi:CheY-like chemotaxis protein